MALIVFQLTEQREMATVRFRFLLDEVIRRLDDVFGWFN